MTKPPVHIIGGGLAGAMAGVQIAQTGQHQVIIHEKTATPRPKVCGEFLSFEAVERLKPLLPDLITSPNLPTIDRALFTTSTSRVEFRLPKPCLGLGRETLDSALLTRAAELGAEVRLGSAIKSLEDLPASAPKVLASGKLNLAGIGRELSGHEATMVGLKMHFQCLHSFPNSLRGLIHLFFFDGGYGGLVEIDQNRVSLAIAVNKKRLAQANGSAEALLDQSAQADKSLGEWLDHLESVPRSNLAIGQVPYGYLRRQAVAEGVFAVGDQAAVIPSFSGDGMAIALATGVWAAEAINGGTPALEFQRQAAKKLRRNIRVAHWISPLIQQQRLLGLGLPLLGVPGISQLLFHMTRTAT